MNDGSDGDSEWDRQKPPEKLKGQSTESLSCHKPSLLTASQLPSRPRSARNWHSIGTRTERNRSTSLIM
eukprot:524184-Hanusia_phi.AAC.2